MDDVEPTGPRYPQVRVDMRPFMAVDAWMHMILETTAALRRGGVGEEEISKYRAAASSETWATTAAWVNTAGRK